MKKKITYTHELYEEQTLEVAGTIEKVEGGRTYVRRIDGYIVDMPTENIIEEVDIG
tara:strand:+ start:715 stop:882 length:168 start_codon:yes stop_codon:yes gene_type:complete